MRSGSIDSYQCSCMSGYVLGEDEHGCTGERCHEIGCLVWDVVVV